MKRPVPLVVGVVLYKNPADEIRRLAASLQSCRALPETPAFHVAFINNGEPDHLKAELRELLPDAEYVNSSGNVGFGRAHNTLMEQAFSYDTVRWYLCLNPDGILHPRAMRELLNEASRHPKPGLVEAIQFPDEHPKFYDKSTHLTDWASGCALLITRECYEAIGGFDDQLFLYCEDVDLSWRARVAGFQVALAPNALVHHYVRNRPEGGSTRQYMVKSGAYLGEKWGGDAFAQVCRDEYQMRAHEPLAIQCRAAPTREMREVANFEHLFHFSEVRW